MQQRGSSASGRVTAWAPLSGRIAMLLTVVLAVLCACLAPTADAVVRYRRSGAATMGAPDAIAGSRDFCEVCTRCQGGAQFAWAGFEEGAECIAYYPTPGMDKARTAVLFFDGDVPGGYHFDEVRMQSHLTSMRRFLDLLARTYDVPFAYVARPGTFGSTGNHRKRRGIAEYQALSGAAVRIRERHGISRLVLAGQSGGATAIGAMLALGLSNVACAVPASGGYDLEGMIDWHAKKRGAEPGTRRRPMFGGSGFNVMDHIAEVPKDNRRRLFILGDMEDKVTPFTYQKAFAQRLQEAGHHAVLVEARAQGGDRHGLTATALRMAGLCAIGKSDEIVSEVPRAGR